MVLWYFGERVLLKDEFVGELIYVTTKFVVNRKPYIVSLFFALIS